MNTKLIFSIILVLAAFSSTAGVRQAEARVWIDARPLVNWNKPGGVIPRGPKINRADARNMVKRCGEYLLATSEPTLETRQVKSVGWLGAAVMKRAGDTVFVSASNGDDGSCRPMGYQIFVFVAGKFVGTVSPEPMAARLDASGSIENVAARRFTAGFSRYREEDALCCPSGESVVTYDIKSADGGRLYVVPIKVVTKLNRK